MKPYGITRQQWVNIQSATKVPEIWMTILYKKKKVLDERKHIKNNY